MEKHYVFLTNNEVKAVLVFANQDEELAATVCAEFGYDQSVWIDDVMPPVLNATYDGGDFFPPLIQG
jgi:hypothetical protein